MRHAVVRPSALRRPPGRLSGRPPGRPLGRPLGRLLAAGLLGAAVGGYAVAAPAALASDGGGASGTASARVQPVQGQAATGARVSLIQAVPGEELDVSLDGRQVGQGAAVGTVLGPFPVAPGEHEIVFSGAAGQPDISSSLSVARNSTTDVVLHLPAAVGGDPVVNSYQVPRGPIGPDEARVLLAHTATVAPADVVVDGQVVFTNIANGEFADADVPAGTLEVALVPTGRQSDPILGPLDVTLEPRTVTMVYAYGRPANGSMDVISRTESLASDGSTPPTHIDTGSAGLAADARVRPFGAGAADPAAAGPAGGGADRSDLALLVAALLGAGATGVALRRRARTEARPGPGRATRRRTGGR